MRSQAVSLAGFLGRAESLAVLSGAGVSTASGIPDYRDRNGERKHSEPIQFSDFVNNESSRRRYWARSFVGWRRFSGAQPNAAHHALADLEAAGKVDMLITQNVDRLHHEAGSSRVIELHGQLGNIRCVRCGKSDSRAAFQQALEDGNPGWHAEVFRYKPDGDAELAEHNAPDFVIPGCVECRGIVKPDVVMFGEGVPKARVQDAMAAVDRSDALLVVGSSLTVFSGYRFARRAAELGIPIGIVNQGKTRADEIAGLKVDADCTEILSNAHRLLRSGCYKDSIC